MADSTGQADLRAENVSRVVEGFALQEYKMKQLCMVQSSSAWTETYYTETAADLTAGGNLSVEGVPRLANMPYGEVTWTKTSGRNVKHAMEGVISWEDAKTNAIDVIARTLLRIGRAVAKSVDGVIAAAVLASAGNTTAANATWNNADISSRDPIQDILDAKALIEVDNYNPNKNGFLLVHPTNYSELLGNANVRNAGQFYTDKVTRNGVVGSLLGLTVVSSNSVTEGGAQVVIAKEAMTWKQVAPLTVKSIEDPGIKWTIRAFEVGQIQVVNPDAICTITGV
ncbi:MAG: hypothetical protein CMI54_04200 [Parcubacteria group bacterium]|jgi:hypothetical protein|nr:hypothetical protein [Parcubacteria group bacterium]|tara:strand:- start:1160 stop:2008 length:849 start_codon:yes stop_codon:yes gene_type:complete